MIYDLPSWVSMDSILEVWSGLVEAYHDVGSYGTHDYQIYSYVLQRRDPRCDHEARHGEAHRENYEQAALALARILLRFQQRYDCECLVDGEAVTTWSQMFDHRVVIRVNRKVR